MVRLMNNPRVPPQRANNVLMHPVQAASEAVKGTGEGLRHGLDMVLGTSADVGEMAMEGSKQYSEQMKQSIHSARGKMAPEDEPRLEPSYGERLESSILRKQEGEG